MFFHGIKMWTFAAGLFSKKMISTRCQTIFDQTAFMHTLGARLLRADEGECEIEVVLTSALTQQHGFAHAGVQASIADHACGIATASLLAENQQPLSIEFKINLLRPAMGERLLAKAKVLRCGKTMAVVESEVVALTEGRVTLTAKMMATIAIVGM
jgi:uncharacterized protein (TIGR00369 family)